MPSYFLNILKNKSNHDSLLMHLASMIKEVNDTAKGLGW